MTFMSKFIIAMCTLCVLVVVSAWIMGGETGKYSTSISIDASPDDVFPYLTDGEKINKWASDVVSVDSFDEDDSVIRKRVVRQEDENVLWEDSILRFQTAVEDDDEKNDFSISIQSRNGGFTNTYFFYLKDNEVSGTNLEYRVTQSASGIDRFFFSFREDDTKAKITAEVTKLKSIVESEVEPRLEDLESDPMDQEQSDFQSPTAGESKIDTSTPTVNFSAAEMPSDVSAAEIQSISALDEPLIEEARSVQLKDRRFESLFATGR